MANAKKEEHGDPMGPADVKKSDRWNHKALDPECRLVVSIVSGKHSTKSIKDFGRDFKGRTRGHLMNLISSDEYPAHKATILNTLGTKVVPLPPLPAGAA